jgi:hypothetical protein
VVVFLLVLSFRLGDRFADEALAGRPVDFGVFGTSVIRVLEVGVLSANPAKPSPATGYVLRLGGKAGTSLFVVGGRVIRVFDQNVTVSSPCAPSGGRVGVFVPWLSMATLREASNVNAKQPIGISTIKFAWAKASSYCDADAVVDVCSAVLDAFNIIRPIVALIVF